MPIPEQKNNVSSPRKTLAMTEPNGPKKDVMQSQEMKFRCTSTGFPTIAQT